MRKYIFDVVEYQGVRCWRRKDDIFDWLVLGHLGPLYRINIYLKEDKFARDA